MGKLRLILGDQLSPSLPCLVECDKSSDVVLLCEVWDEATYVKHHKKKIAFLFSAMRHFAAALKTKGFRVAYTRLDDHDNTGSLQGEVERALNHYALESVVVTYPGEYRVLEMFKRWETVLGVKVEIKPDDRFLATPKQFSDWAKGRKQLRMEYFYRDLRKQYGILMDGDKPQGGKWNYDAQNRKPPKGWVGDTVTL